MSDGANRYRQVADAISRCAANLRLLEGGASRAESVTALLESRDTTVDAVSKAENRFRTAATALETYAQVLDRVQVDTVNALYAARQAANERDEANRVRAYYQGLAEDYRFSDNDGDDESYTRYRRLARGAGNDADAAQGRIEAQIRIVDQAVVDRDAAAQRAVDAIEGATSADALNDSWWDNWGATITMWIAKIAEAISAIAGILALLVCWIPVIGQALAGVLFTIAAIAGIVAAIANIALAATGKQSWGQAIVSVIFAALGCVGLGGLKGTMVGVKSAFGNLMQLGGRQGTGVMSALVAMRGGVKALGGVKGMAAGYVNNLVMSVKNAGKYVKLLTGPRTPARYGPAREVNDATWKWLRRSSPNGDVRRMIEPNYPEFNSGPRDWVLPGNPTRGPLSPDHIVPLDKLTRMEGFGKLTREQQLALANERLNFFGLSRRANSSKQALSYLEWGGLKGGAKVGYEIPVEPLVRTEMSRIEVLMEQRLQAMIDAMLRGK